MSPCSQSSMLGQLNKVLIFIENPTVYVPLSELGLPQPLSPYRVCPPPPHQRVGAHSPAARGGEGGGGGPIPMTGEKAQHSAYSVASSKQLILAS
jgi:hypothetical protein